MKPKCKKLKNGLRIVTVPMRDNPTVTVMVLVEAGSHYETKENNGISHFLEHMCFKGTSNRPSSLDISHELDALGAESNAFTWYEYTGYHAKSRAKNFKKILDVVADIYLHSTVPESELEKEKGVIIEEINMYEDVPMRNVYRLLDKVMYGDQPAGRSVLGTKGVIRRMTRDEFVAYRTRHYVAKKTAVVVAGDIDSREVFAEVERQFKGINMGEVAGKPKVRERQNAPQIGLQYKKSDQSHLVLGFRTFPARDKRSTTVEVLAAILGQGMSSRLFQKLRNEMGVCYYARAATQGHTDHGKLTIATGVDNKRVEEVLAVVLGEVRRLKQERVDEKELRKAKEYAIGMFLMNMESSDEVTDFFGSQEILRQKIKTPRDIVREIRQVTPQKIQTLAKEVFQNRTMNLALIGPFNNKSALVKKFRL